MISINFLKKIFRYVKLTVLSKTVSVKLISSYIYDFYRFKAHSALLERRSEGKLIGKIIVNYHVLEKGITMPQRRLGFGQERAQYVIDDCSQYIEKYGIDNLQLRHAVGVLLEYRQVHDECKYVLPKDLLNGINKLQGLLATIEPTQQPNFTKKSYFDKSKDDFYNFSLSRHSLRNYSDEEVAMESIYKSIKLASKAPSACNRQTCSVYTFQDRSKIKEILELQGGNRGFGHLANKLIIVVANLEVFGEISERYQAYIDGGIYAMNLLYALHYYNIGCCILNCSHNPEKDRRMRLLCGVKENEVFISMISCGIPPENFSVAISKRSDYETKITII
ncbi:nitroreductase family protein [Sphingobacterium multivorum]|uniref:nitroreductase family protein n=1 Tax=Sphingobacterium multivorum TaxID=28454 RepID=UPI00289CDCF7|nr:nitroreductase family protein [Sphingobacterium multivorum]